MLPRDVDRPDLLRVERELRLLLRDVGMVRPRLTAPPQRFAQIRRRPFVVPIGHGRGRGQPTTGEHRQRRRFSSHCDIRAVSPPGLLLDKI